MSEDKQTAEYVAAISNSGTSPSMGGNIFYSNNKEKIYSGKIDLSKPLDFLPVKTNIKLGFLYQERIRDFSSRQFGYSRYNKGNRVLFDQSLLTLPEDLIFAPENLGEIQPYMTSSVNKPATQGVGGFKLEEVTKLNDTYHASFNLNAGYVMFENKINSKLRLIWGARLEAYRQTLESFEDDGGIVKIDTTITDILPSANLILSLTDKSNLRFSYSQTLSRPEFRELAPFGFFDYVTLYSIRGNPELKRALINNYDCRYEIFPTGGQVISTSLFYKEFSDAIEQVNRADVPRELYYQNVPRVRNVGIEIEYRLNLATLIKSTKNKFLLNTTIFSNIALINSKVDISQIKGAIGEERPLQGQSPYILNAGIFYMNRERNFNVNIAYNQIGRRIAIVGNTQEPDTYENPKPALDLQISKTFFDKIEVKLNIKDLLARNLIFYQDLNGNKKLDNNIDNVMSVTNYGQSISLGLSYNIK